MSDGIGWSRRAADGPADPTPLRLSEVRSDLRETPLEIKESFSLWEVLNQSGKQR